METQTSKILLDIRINNIKKENRNNYCRKRPLGIAFFNQQFEIVCIQRVMNLLKIIKQFLKGNGLTSYHKSN